MYYFIPIPVLNAASIAGSKSFIFDVPLATEYKIDYIKKFKIN